jgi:uncharacterized protein YbaR (Trm112 family)
MRNISESLSKGQNFINLPRLAFITTLALSLSACKKFDTSNPKNLNEKISTVQINTDKDLSKYTQNPNNHKKLLTLLEGCQDGSNIKQDIVIIRSAGYCHEDNFNYRIIDGVPVFRIDVASQKRKKIENVGLEVTNPSKAIVIKPSGTLKSEDGKVVVVKPGEFSAGFMNIESEWGSKQKTTGI